MKLGNRVECVKGFTNYKYEESVGYTPVRIEFGDQGVVEDYDGIIDIEQSDVWFTVKLDRKLDGEEIQVLANERCWRILK